MSLSLTVAEDILPAISGIARDFADRKGWSYRAGLWLEDIRRDLLWRADSVDKSAANRVFLAPSSSWASLGLNSGDPVSRAFRFETPIMRFDNESVARV